MVNLDHRHSSGTHALADELVCRKVNLLTYKTVISLQTSISAQLERSWTQEPATLEDALGRVTPVHLEFLDSWEVSWEVSVGLGSKKSNTFQGFRFRPRNSLPTVARSPKDKTKRVRTSIAFNRCFLPGQRINMSMIFDGGFGGVSSCPEYYLVTSQTEEGVDAQM